MEGVLRPVKSGVKGVIRLRDRLLHPWRRRTARRKLASVSSDVRSATFVCHGNICRSPYAERVFASSLPDGETGRIRIESTGFHPEEGRRPPDEARHAARRLGTDLSAHRSRSLVAGDAEWGDREGAVVFVMEPEQAGRFQRAHGNPPLGIYVLGDFDPESVSKRGIRDPFGHPPEVFDEAFERIRRCVEEVGAAWNVE